jgi:hypothetical protein
MSAGNGKPFQPDFVVIPYAVFVDPNLSHAAKLTYGRLKLYAGEDGRAFPKHETLASEVCLRDRQLRTVLSELQAAGWIEWRRARFNCAYTVFSDRQKTATLNDQDRRKTASQSGGKLPIRSAENCHSRVAENCHSGSAENCHSRGPKPNGCNADVTRNRKPKRSIENHHQKRGIEKKNPEAAVEGSTATPKALSLKSDDEKPKTARESEIYAHPEDELKAIYREKTGDELSPDVERRIWELVEIRGVPRKQFMDELRKHVPNVWKNPAGFLTNFARKIGSVATPEPPTPKPIEPPKNGNGRCSACNGIGYAHWDADLAARVYCDCRMGHELRRVDLRSVAPVVPPAAEAVA